MQTVATFHLFSGKLQEDHDRIDDHVGREDQNGRDDHKEQG